MLGLSYKQQRGKDLTMDLTNIYRYMQDHQGNSVAEAISDAIDNCTDKRPMALKTWLQSHDVVDTFQLTVYDDGTPYKLWAPGPRGVDTSHATFASFDGSRRSYAKLQHIAHGSEAYATYEPDFKCVLIYATA